MTIQNLKRKKKNNNSSDRKRIRLLKDSAIIKTLSDKHVGKQVEEEIKILKQQMEFILGVTKTGLDIIDSEFNIRYIDPEWAKTYGDQNGRKCYEYFMGGSGPCPGCGIPKALKIKKPTVTEEILVKENSRPIQVTTIPFQSSNGEWLVAEVNVDISERKRIEEALFKAHEELEIRVQERTAQLTLANEALQLEITERRQTEEALQRSEGEAKRLAQENAIMAEIGRIINSTLNIEEVYDRFAQEVHKLIPFDGIAINIINHEEGTVTVPYVSGIGVPGCQPGDIFPLASSVTGVVAHKHSGLIIQTEDREELQNRFPTLLSAFDTGLRSVISVPLISKDQVIGTIHFRSAKPNAYSNQDLKLAESIGTQIAGAIANVQLFSERKRVEEALRESENKYRELTDFLSETVFECNKNGRVLFTNRQGFEAFGYTQEDFDMGLTVFQMVIPEDREKGERNLERLLRGEKLGSTEYTALRKDGSTFPAIISSNVIIRENRPVGLRGLVIDITNPKKAEEALRESEEKYRTILGNIQDGYYEGDLAGNFTFFNDSMCRIFGYPKEELMGMNNRQYTDQETAKKLFQAFNKVYRTGEPGRECDYEIIRKDGSRRYVEASISLKKNPSGQPIGFRGIVRDITERKRAEEALRESEAKYRRLHETMMDAFVNVDMTGRIHEANRAYQTMVGYSEEELRQLTYMDLTPKKWHAFESSIVEEQILAQGHSEVYEKEYRRKDGTIFPVELRTFLMRDDRGNPMGMWAIVRDITERKRAEEALRESEKKYRGVIENIQDVFYRSDFRGRLIMGSPSGAKMFGYDTIGEMIGTPLDSFWPDPKDRERLLVQIKATGSVKDFEAVLKKKDGTTFNASFTTHFYYDDYGNFQGTEGIIRDITERKRAEAALRESEEKFRNLVETTSDWIWETDANGNYSYASPKVHDLLGYEPDEVIGRKPFVFMPPGEAESIAAGFARMHAEHRQFFNLENVNLRKDGKQVILETSGVPRLDSQGNFLGYRGIDRDITERKRAEEALRESESRLRIILDSIQTGILIIDPETHTIVDLNPAATKLIGAPKEKIAGSICHQYICPAELGKCPITDLKQNIDNKERILLTANGETRPIIKTVGPIMMGGRKYLLETFIDINERKQTEEALRQSEERYRTILENIEDGYYEVDLPGNFTFFNESLCRMLGYSRDELMGMGNQQYTDEENQKKLFQAFNEVYRTGEPAKGFAWEVIRKGGDKLFGEVSVSLIKDSKGKPIGFRGIARDITERKRIEGTLRESEERYRTLVEESFDGIFIQKGPKIIFANQRLYEMLGYDEGELLEMDHWLVYHPDYQKLTRERAKARMRGEKVLSQYEVKLKRKDGSTFDGEVNARRIMFGNEAGIQVWVRDITERKQSEDLLRAEKQRFQTLSENAPFGMVMIDQDGTFKYINPKFRELFGYDLTDIPDGKTWFRKAFPDSTYRHQAISDWIRDLESAKQGEKRPKIFTVRCKDGTEKIINFISVQLETGENLMACEDITEHRRAEEENKVLQEQLRQSQKMEAVGRLGGGIAHDFNNLLTIIKGYSQLSLLDLKESDPLWGNIQAIQKATQRATDLTRQLLAFSRRQILDLKVLDLNALLRDLDKMLRRIIGEDIELVTLLAGDLGRVKIDPGQIEQVVLNLAVNARDAIPSGGKLTIETANVELDEKYVETHMGVTPGHYVRLSVSDTGAGMSQQVKEKIFEPFFTTKEKGKGTGLGLSTVYGIVKQSSGNIWVYSEPGHGTTIKIYLPRVEEDLDSLHKRDETDFLPRGRETVLLVEDEPSVRDLAHRLLNQQGYKVLEAANGEEALRVVQEHIGEEIHLLLTDVVMPQMGGKELAEKLKILRPDIKILYTSGYTDDAIVNHGILERGTNFLQKPFSLKTLSHKVREVLDG